MAIGHYARSPARVSAQNSDNLEQRAPSKGLDGLRLGLQDKGLCVPYPPHYRSSSSHGRFPRMKRWLALVAVVLFAAAPVQAAGLTGHYLESRTCDVWTGPCFANAETSLGGKHAVLAWKVQEGTLDNVRLDGLGVVAVVETSDTLGLEQT